MIYLIMFCALIGVINSSFGLNIGNGIKVNVTDILFIIFIVYEFILKKRKLIKFEPIKFIFLLLSLMIMSLYFAIINDATIGNCIRVLRNIIYVIVMFWLVYNNYRFKKNINTYRDLIIFSWISIINCITNVIFSFMKNNWFMYYRENSTFQVFMFVFFLFYNTEDYEKINIKIMRSITTIFLGICIFLSQERLQILAVFMSIVIYIIYKVMKLLTIKKITIKISPKKLFINCILMVVIFIVIINILRIEYIQNYIEYFLEYRVGSIITSNGFKLDGSLSDRQIQLVNILDRDFRFYIIGSGLCSLYTSAIGQIHIVDGMWLWIFKDLGIVGILVLLIVYISVAIETSKLAYNKKSISLGLVSILVLQAFTPNLMLGISDSIFIGYILGVICLDRRKILI